MPSYLRGQWADHGWWHYYLYVMLLKMPLGTWGLALLAAVVAAWSCIQRIHHAPQTASQSNPRSPAHSLPKRKESYVAPGGMKC